MPDPEDGHVAAPRQVTAPHILSVGDPSFEPVNVAEPAWQEWRAELATIGGRSPLLHFVDAPETRIELGATHPGGLARFIAGNATLLSSLIRDDLALRGAKLAAGNIAAKGLELSTARGIPSIHLGIGIAEWEHGEVSFRAPVLLRPLAIRRYGRDFELKLRGAPYLNPELARALNAQFQISLDAEAFVALAESDGAFKPNPVIDRLRGLTSHLRWFNVQPRLVVSSFADVATAMHADAAKLAHPVLDALAGNPSARWGVIEGNVSAEPLDPDARPPQLDTLLLNADAEQEKVIAQIAVGNSIVVKTLPGAGGTQTIVNALGCLVAQNKRVLVVGPRRDSLRDIATRLNDAGLPGFAVTPDTLRRDLIRSITRNEKAKPAQVAEVDEALLRLRKVLLDYRTAMTRRDSALAVSVLDCLTELSRLALLPNPPATTARLSRQSVEALAGDRSHAAEAMVQAANLGEFKYGPEDSPWYGAAFATSESAGQAHQLAKRLHATELPRLLERATTLIEGTGMRPFDSITELGVYLRLLTDIRDTLDRFLPVVFDRSLGELIAATASRKDHRDMPRMNRRRLRKLAKEYVRPGVHIGDMNESLTRIQQQRVLWQRFVAGGVTPQVPIGIADVQVAYQQVIQDLSYLDVPLGAVTREAQLASMPIPRLLETVEALAAESDVLANLQERAELMTTLRGLQLDPLIADLAARHVGGRSVAAELELAWWQSALEYLLNSDRALLNANTSMLDRLEADFRLVDEAHSAGNAMQLAWQLAENWQIGLVDWPEEAAELKRALRRDRLTSQELQQVAPHLSRSIAPVWLASPYEVAKITDHMVFDTVILVDAGATTLAENVGAIRRGKQIVAFGDPVTQAPTAFEIAIVGEEAEHSSAVRGSDSAATGTALAAGEPAASDLSTSLSTDLAPGPSTDPAVDSAAGPGQADPGTVAVSASPPTESAPAESVLDRLGTLLPTLSLTRSYRAGGEDLVELVNRRFYAGTIDSLPWAGSYLGHGSLILEYVSDGHGMPDSVSGAVESVDAEVNRVVDLVLEHAGSRPNESLMVITASPKHAVRVQQAVLAALATRPHLNNFILDDRAEPFMVTTIEQAVAQSRDRVIFSIGYGRTPHGRMLSDFGSLGRPGGERMLAVAMTRARRSMVIVSCFKPEDIGDGRMQHGAIALAEILAEVEARGGSDSFPDDRDPMLVDLARRLQARGLRVTLGHRGKLGLVVSNGGICLTVTTDTELHDASLRESLRLRPEMLRRLGWHYLRVHAFELFSDPDAVADRIMAMVGAVPSVATEPIPVLSGSRS